MKDTLIILSGAYSPTAAPHRHSYIGEERVLQFLNGYNSFFNNFKGREDTDVYVMDGTIDSTESIDDRIKEVIPDYVTYELHLNNKYGAQNNGAGVIETWRLHEDLLKKYKWIIHFEPRTVLRGFDFFNHFYSNKKSLFALDNTGQQFYTGLFSISSELLLDFSTLDLDVMIQHQLGIEKAFYDYMQNKPKEIVDSVGIVWFDKSTEKSYYF